MNARTTPSRVRRRYDQLARVYDRVTFEKVVYAGARARAIQLLRLEPGDTVVDVGCGHSPAVSSRPEARRAGQARQQHPPTVFVGSS